MRLSPGTRVGPYEIVAPLGAGGMGEVYRARDTRLSRDVALKFLPANVAGDPLRRARFEQEARTASSLNHPNIVSIYDIGEQHGISYIVSEVVEGESLRAVLQRGPLPVRKTIDLSVQIADALAAAHASGIVHRDMKPENVMITRDGRVKLLDFGLARQFSSVAAAAGDSTLTLTKEGTLVGTLGYMSPEQVRGKMVDHRSDIFALGAVMYEMLAGRRAFERDSAVETLNAILTADPPEVPDGSKIPTALESIVRHCLEKGADERFQSAWDLAFALEAISNHPTGQAAVPPGLSLRRRRAVGWLMLASFVAGALATYVAIRATSKPRRVSLDNAVFAQLTSDPGAELFPSLSPDGRLVAYAGRASGNWNVYLLELGSPEPVNLTRDSAADDTQPAISPDGKRIAFRSERNGGGIFIMDTAGRSLRQISDSGFNPAWSPDGREVLFADESITRPEDRQIAVSKLWAAEVASGRKRLVSNGDAVQPKYSPHGDRIAYWAIDRSGHRDIWTIPAGGGTPIPVTRDGYIDWSPAWSPDGKYLYFSSDRGGAMGIWRAPIQETTGRVLGQPELVRTPSRYNGHLSFALDGRRMAYTHASFGSTLRRVVFDPVTETILDEPKDITEASREASRPAVSPDGQWLAFNSSGTDEDLFLVRTDGTALRQLTHETHRDRGPRWSPDGKEVAFFSKRSGNWEIWTVSPDGGGSRQVTRLAGPNVAWPVWSPDGRTLAYTLFGLNSFLIDARQDWARQNPEGLPLMTGGRESFAPWSWSPDGRKLAGFQQRADGKYSGIVIYTLASKTFERLTESGVEPMWLADSRRLLFNLNGKIHLADTATKRSHEVLSIAPDEVARRGFAVSRDDRFIYFSVANAEADVWLLTYE